MKEKWKDVLNYEGVYQISNLGRIKSLGNDKSRKTKILKTYIDKNGYEFVTLRNKGTKKNFSIHRLVAMAFVTNKNIFKYNSVNHIDENKLNNKASNLEWCTSEYNAKYTVCRKVKFITYKNNKLLINFNYIKWLWDRIKSKIGNYPKG